jgi:hypothetical protein
LSSEFSLAAVLNCTISRDFAREVGRTFKTHDAGSDALHPALVAPSPLHRAPRS